MNCAVLVSGEGSNLRALLERLEPADARIVAVGADRPAPALGHARRAGVPVRIFPADAHPDRVARDRALAGWLEERGAELVVLAGYMSLLDPAFLTRFPDRVVNVHPSLLPAFPGVRAIEQAVDYGVVVFGVTVHLVDEGVDTGPVILQRAIELPGARDPDEVHRRLQPLEHELLPEAVRLIARGRVRRDPEHPRRLVIG